MNVRHTSRLLLLATLCSASACTDWLLGPKSPATHAEIFDAVWRDFDLHYSFFELKNVDWSALRTQYRPAALQATSDAQLAQVIGTMLNKLADIHVVLTPGGGHDAIHYPSPYDSKPTYFDITIVSRRYVTGLLTTAKGEIQYGSANGVGYIYVPSFDAGWPLSEFDTALSYLSSTSAIVIDVRENRGGIVQMAQNVAGRFADEERTYSYVRLRNGPHHSDFTSDIPQRIHPALHTYRKPVFVLTDRRVFSAAEDFVLAMRALPNVTIVGDTTAGTSGGPITRDLPNGWTYALSEWIEYTPDHQIFEGIGLGPNVVVKATSADLAAVRDPVLSRALRLATPTP